METSDLPTSDGHPFFERLNRILEDSGFDAFVEELCASFYADRLGRPSLRPGRCFRMLFIGYFEGLSSERGIAWRVARFAELAVVPGPRVDRGGAGSLDMSRTRRRFDVTGVAVRQNGHLTGELGDERGRPRLRLARTMHYFRGRYLCD